MSSSSFSIRSRSVGPMLLIRSVALTVCRMVAIRRSSYRTSVLTRSRIVAGSHLTRARHQTAGLGQPVRDDQPRVVEGSSQRRLECTGRRGRRQHQIAHPSASAPRGDRGQQLSEREQQDPRRNRRSRTVPAPPRAGSPDAAGDHRGQAEAQAIRHVPTAAIPSSSRRFAEPPGAPREADRRRAEQRRRHPGQHGRDRLGLGCWGTDREGIGHAAAPARRIAERVLQQQPRRRRQPGRPPSRR